MHHELAEKIQANPRFQELVKRRNRFAWSLAVIMLAVYYTYILVIAFSPDFFATALSPNTVISIGVPVGAGIILFAWVLTGIYVQRANTEFDVLTRQIQEDAK